MSTILEYENIVAFHPGYYITEIIEDMGISQSEFADRVGVADKILDDLVKGRTDMSISVAEKLSAMLGISADVWLNLQNAYEQKEVKVQKIRDFDEQ